MRQGRLTARGGRRAPAALDHHPRARARAGRRGRHAHGAVAARRRRVPAVLGRPDVDDLRGRRRARSCAMPGRCDAGRPGARRRGQRGGRARQHHRAPVPVDDVRSGAGAPVAGGDDGGARGARRRRARRGGARAEPPRARARSAARKRRGLGAPPPADHPARGRRAASPPSASACTPASTRSTSSAPTTRAASRSSAGCRTTCRSASTLYRTQYRSGIPASSLPPARRESLLDHKLRSHSDATDLVRQLELGQLQGS